MDKNNKIFKTIVIGAILLLLTGYGLILYFTLDEPVFFQHYYDYMMSIEEDDYEYAPFSLGYISNVNDDRTITQLEFPDYPELTIQVSTQDNSSAFNYNMNAREGRGAVYGRYQIKTLYGEIIMFPKDQELSDVILRKARIQFSDDSEMTVDIGEIHLVQYRPREDVFEHGYSSSSSDNTGKVNNKVLKSMKLMKVESPLLDKFKDRIEIIINGMVLEEALGMVLNENEFLEVSTKIRPGKNRIEQYQVLDIMPNLIFSSVDGEEYTKRLHNIDTYKYDYAFLELYRYIKAREGN